MRISYSLIFVLIVAFMRLDAQTPAFQQRAWAGDSLAMMQLSEAFLFGKGVTKNQDSSKAYLEKAAKKGLPEAEYLLGTQYLTDIFTAKVYAKGVDFLHKAAAHGHEAAQYKLAEVHSIKGQETQQDAYFDLKKAYSYGEMAALQGNLKAMMFCAEARLKGSGTLKSDSIAVVWFRKAADEKNYVPGMIRLADMYWLGKVNGKVEPFLALAYYEKARAMPNTNVDQRTLADEGIFNVDQFFKQVQNTFLDANPALPFGMFDYRIR
jgi:TPR repeat protein